MACWLATATLSTSGSTILFGGATPPAETPRRVRVLSPGRVAAARGPRHLAHHPVNEGYITTADTPPGRQSRRNPAPASEAPAGDMAKKRSACSRVTSAR